MLGTEAEGWRERDFWEELGPGRKAGEERRRSGRQGKLPVLQPNS